MTIDAAAAAAPESAEARIAAIRDRLDALRTQTSVLSERAHEAAVHAAETRNVSARVCTHATEAAAMRVELDVLEDELEGLRIAMDTRGVIEQAKGMLMLQNGCDADAAFAMLVSMSQTSHRKLVEVARALVAAWQRGAGAEA